MTSLPGKQVKRFPICEKFGVDIPELDMSGVSPSSEIRNISEVSVSHIPYLGVQGTGTVLNLCSGTGRDASVMSEYYDRVVAIDITSKVANECECDLARLPDIVSDILEWDYIDWYSKWLSSGNSVVTCVLATPPCNTFSNMRNMPGRVPASDSELEHASSIVHKCREIQEYFDKWLYSRYGIPVVMVMENPSSSSIRDSGGTSGLLEVTSSWCKMGSRLRKDTTFFTNLGNLKLPPVCSQEYPCKSFSKGIRHWDACKVSRQLLYSLPSGFIRHISKVATRYIRSLCGIPMPSSEIDTLSAPLMSGINGPCEVPEPDNATVPGSEGQPEPGSDNNNSSGYSIEYIMDRKGKGGKIKYKVKWVGYDEPTWETSQGLYKSADGKSKIMEYLSGNGGNSYSSDMHYTQSTGSTVIDGVSDEVLCASIEYVYGTVIEESDLLNYFSPEDINAAKLAEYKGWEEFGVHDRISNNKGFDMLNANTAVFMSFRWVYSYTEDDDGNKQLKARLVLKGFQDTRGLTGEAPTVDKGILRLFLYCSQALPGEYAILDVKKAFLQAPAAGGPSILIRDPMVGSDTSFLRLKMAVYGSIDAAKQW